MDYSDADAEVPPDPSREPRPASGRTAGLAKCVLAGIVLGGVLLGGLTFGITFVYLGMLQDCWS